ncbi:hypothetical protein VSDG_04545 [Cytospora chrysosperma]|uniref:Uncharacterized protein n=1 Tax=Cytospora chrysosperma TaxID=252740 RepID=A0A423W2G9_CYTCH|nr:hypothetical protein VSDG_04545 [Valsa sordida]
MSNPIDTLGLSCPNGGDFYVCQDSKLQFLGCCASDPCADGSGHCPQSDLRYSSFDTDTYDNISTQSCVGKGRSNIRDDDSIIKTNINIDFDINIDIDFDIDIDNERKWRERRGVVVKGSDPPSPSAVMSNPTNSYLYHDPDRSLHAPLPFQSPVNSPTRVLAVANEAPTHDNSRTNSATTITGTE